MGLLSLWTEARSGGPQLCHCIYGASYPYGGSPLPGQHIYRTTDFIHWTPLPPIPVKGTSVQRSGVYQTLGMTADGRLLASGADPREGVPTLLDHDGRVYGPPPALWKWNTHSGRWEVASTHVPCVDLQSCYMYSTGAAVATGASGKVTGTSFWITVQINTGQNEPTQGYYRLFIPAA
jgi:hypothetical protein